MSFSCPIGEYQQYGLTCIRIDVPLTVITDRGEAEQLFVFDTGCEVTMVSEDIATELGLPTGGRPVGVTGSTSGGSGRLVNVRFRFPRTTSGGPGLEVESTWVIVSGRRAVELLGFQEVHRHFQTKLLEFEAYFIRWP